MSRGIGALILDWPEPPLPRAEAQAFVALVNSALDEPFLVGITEGRWRDDACFRLVRGRVGEELAATGWVGWAKSFPGIGAMAGVVTRPAFRRRGIASIVCARLCEAFDKAGGRLLYLAVAEARPIYERLGFEPVAGQVMCRAAPGSAPGDGFVPGQGVTARGVNWGDVGRLMPLYLWPHECLMLDSGIRFPTVALQGPSRCVGVFWATWQSTVESGGRWSVLENERGVIVASAVARPSAEAVRVDFIWHPDYTQEGRAFLSEFLRKTEAELGLPCEICACKEDKWKRRQARELGFSSETLSDQKVPLGERQLAVVTFRRENGRG